MNLNLQQEQGRSSSQKQYLQRYQAKSHEQMQVQRLIAEILPAAFQCYCSVQVMQMPLHARAVVVVALTSKM